MDKILSNNLDNPIKIKNDHEHNRPSKIIIPVTCNSQSKIDMPAGSGNALARFYKQDIKKSPIECETPEQLNIMKILTDLKFLSEIKPTDKLCLDPTINIDKSYVPCVTRWWNNYNRNDTIDRLEEIFNCTFTLLETLINNQRNNIYYIQKYKNIDLLQELLKLLDNSINGLDSLKITYNEDKNIISRLDTLIKKINLQKQYANECIKFN